MEYSGVHGVHGVHGVLRSTWGTRSTWSIWSWSIVLRLTQRLKLMLGPKTIIIICIKYLLRTTKVHSINKTIETKGNLTAE